MTKETPPRWSKAIAKGYIGKYILIKIFYFDKDGNETLKQQLHGIIETADKCQGIKVALKGIYEGLNWIMPPDPSINSAKPGVYTLDTTGETLNNPDLIITWRIGEPGPEQIDVNSDTVAIIRKRIESVRTTE
jgi:hypothetical protein